MYVVFFASVELTGQGKLLRISEFLRPPTLPASRASCRQSSVRSLSDEITLELGQGAEDMEDELPT
jgi:hypothetical protein